MAGVKITDLPAAPSALLTDVFPVDQLPGPVTYKESNQQLLTLFQSNGQALTRTDDTNVTLTLGGSPATSLLNPASLTLGWTGVLSGTRGGTGVNNGASTITLGGSLSTIGAFTSAFTMTGNTNVNFPTSGTLATTGQLPTPSALTKTDDTNVTLTLGGTPATALLQATSLTLGWTGQLSMARGGSNANLTASNGGIIYSTSTAMAVLSGTATAGQMLQSGASSAPSWSTTTYPATNAINTLLYASSANIMSALATANNGVLITSAGGVPSISSTLPSGISATNMNLTTPTLGVATATSIAFNPTTGGIVGTATNNNASAGFVGEFYDSGLVGSVAFTTTNVSQNMTSIASLPAGDWDVDYAAQIFFTNTTFSSATSNPLLGGLTTSSATNPGGVGIGNFYSNLPVVNHSLTMSGTKRFSLASATTIYLVGGANWLANAPTFYCQMTARRRR